MSANNQSRLISVVNQDYSENMRNGMVLVAITLFICIFPQSSRADFYGLLSDMKLANRYKVYHREFIVIHAPDYIKIDAATFTPTLDSTISQVYILKKRELLSNPYKPGIVGSLTEELPVNIQQQYVAVTKLKSGETQQERKSDLVTGIFNTHNLTKDYLELEPMGGFVKTPAENLKIYQNRLKYQNPPDSENFEVLIYSLQKGTVDKIIGEAHYTSYTPEQAKNELIQGNIKYFRYLMDNSFVGLIIKGIIAFSILLTVLFVIRTRKTSRYFF